MNIFKRPFFDINPLEPLEGEKFSMNLIESCPIDSDTLPYINSVAFYPEVLNSISEFPDFNYYLELNKISFEELVETLKSLFACNAFDELNDFVLYCYQNNLGNILFEFFACLNKVRQGLELRFWKSIAVQGRFLVKNTVFANLQLRLFYFFYNQFESQLVLSNTAAKVGSVVDVSMEDSDQTDDTVETPVEIYRRPDVTTCTQLEDWKCLGGEVFPKLSINLLERLGLPFVNDVLFTSYDVNTDGLKINDLVIYCKSPLDRIILPFGTKLLESKNTDSGLIYSFAYIHEDSMLEFNERLFKQLSQMDVSSSDFDELLNLLNVWLPNELKLLEGKSLNSVLEILTSFLKTCTYNIQDFASLYKKPEDVFWLTLHKKIGSCFYYSKVVATILIANGFKTYICANDNHYMAGRGFWDQGHAFVLVEDPETKKLIEFDPTAFLQTDSTLGSFGDMSSPQGPPNLSEANEFREEVQELRKLFKSMFDRDARPIEYSDVSFGESPCLDQDDLEPPIHEELISDSDMATLKVMQFGDLELVTAEESLEFENQIKSDKEFKWEVLRRFYANEYPDISENILNSADFEGLNIVHLVLDHFNGSELPRLPNIRSLVIMFSSNIDNLKGLPASVERLELIVSTLASLEGIPIGLKSLNVDENSQASLDEASKIVLGRFEEFTSIPKVYLNNLKNYIDFACNQNSSMKWVSIFKTFLDSQATFDLDIFPCKYMQFKIQLLGYTSKLSIFDVFEIYFLLDQKDREAMLENRIFMTLFQLVYLFVFDFVNNPIDSEVDNQLFVKPDYESLMDYSLDVLMSQIFKQRFSDELIQSFYNLRKKREKPLVLKCPEVNFDEIPVEKNFRYNGFFRSSFDFRPLYKIFKSVKGSKLRQRLSASSDFEHVSDREYQYGDDVRRINHPASARMGKLIIKQFKKSPETARVSANSVFVVPFSYCDYVDVSLENIVHELVTLSIKEKVELKVYHQGMNKILKFNFFQIGNLRRLRGIKLGWQESKLIYDEICKEMKSSLEACLRSVGSLDQVPTFPDVDCMETVYLNYHPGFIYKTVFADIEKKGCSVLNLSLVYGRYKQELR